MAQLAKQITDNVESYLDSFRKVNLEQINAARLMNRVDHKFVLTREQLLSMIPDLCENYFVLSVGNVCNQPYTSTYFDTHDLAMYFAHHNRRAGRYKIRQRKYEASGDAFLEIKYKDNKGMTHKSRVATPKLLKHISLPYFDFVIKNSAYHPLALKPVLTNSFSRFTLVNKKMNQRITVDTELSFYQNDKSVQLPELVVVEVKSTRDNLDSTIFNLLHNKGIKPGSMSKYCVGMALLNPQLKQNLFKQKINHLKHISHVA